MQDTHTSHAEQVRPQTPRKRETFSRQIWDARIAWAASFDKIMREFRKDRLDEYSNGAVARGLGVSTREVQYWRSGERAMPAALVDLLPWPIRRRLLEESNARVGGE